MTKAKPEKHDLTAQNKPSELAREQRCRQNNSALYTSRARLIKMKHATTPATQQTRDKAQAPETESIKWRPVTRSITETSSSTQLEVMVGGFTILVPQDFHAETFTEVCKALRCLC